MNIDLMIEVRAQARAAKMWDVADRLRRELRQNGVIVRDTADFQETILLPPSITPDQWEAKQVASRRANADFDAWLFMMRQKLGHQQGGVEN